MKSNRRNDPQVKVPKESRVKYLRVKDPKTSMRRSICVYNERHGCMPLGESPRI